MKPIEIFEAKAYYNKWLNQLTEDEKDLIMEMLKEAQQESIPIKPPVKLATVYYFNDEGKRHALKIHYKINDSWIVAQYDDKQPFVETNSELVARIKSHRLSV